MIIWKVLTLHNACFRTTKIVYKDLGKEIYQLEVSNKVSVPKDWSMKSSTSVSAWDYCLIKLLDTTRRKYALKHTGFF